MKTHFVTLCALVYLCLALSWGAVPRDFAVDLKATISDTAPHITLSWTQRVQSNITAQKIHRRLKGATVWTKLADLTTTQTSYIDSTAVVATEYEYWMERTLTGLSPSTAMGYLSAGVKVPEIHSRGVLLLVVDDTMVTPLAGEIAQLKLDLAGDGWVVRTISAPRTGTAISTKGLIKTAYDFEPADVKAVYLLGHVPVPYSGNHAPDAHGDHVGAWPADGYYGEMNGTWTDTTVTNETASSSRNDNKPGDGKFDLTYFNNLVELQVGRVDLHTMTKAPVSGVTEVTRLRRYLKKAHDFRHKQGAYAAIPRRTLIRDGFGHAFSSEPFAVTAWAGAFSAVGGTVVEAPSDQWFSQSYAGGNDYLWGHGCGGGSYESAATLGTTTDFGRKTSRVVFTSIFGSYHGDWDSSDNLMRAAIAGNADGTSLGLSCFWAGRPNWFPYPLGMGETMGYMTRLSMNGNLHGVNILKPGISSFGGTHTGLMGDPALRMHVVEPPRKLAATSAAGAVNLSWAPSTETALQGYHVYRSGGPGGSYERLTTTPLTSSNYTDSSGILPDVPYVYLVRTLKLENAPGGSYYNLSNGSAVEVMLGTGPDAMPASPADLAATGGTNGVLLTWADIATDETGYRLERKTGASGSYAVITTTGADATSFTDPGPLAQGNVYFYRVTAVGAAGDSFASNTASYEAIAGFTEFVATRTKVNKTAGTVTVSVRRFGGSGGTVSVNYATSNSTAAAGSHYTATSGTLTWVDGNDDDKTITVPVTNTAQPQLPRQFKLTLTSPTNGLLLTSWVTMAVQIEDPTATLAAPWTGVQLGTVTDISPAVSAEGVIGDSLIGGSGAVQDATSEAGRFIYQTRTGDQMITVKVPTGVVAQMTSRFAVMVRSSTATNAVMAATVTANPTAAYGTRFVNRLTAGGAAADTPDADNNLDTTRWLRLYRVGTTFYSQTSGDGVTWTALGSTTIPGMPASAMWGIFHFCAGLNTTTNYADYQLATYENALVENLPVPPTPGNFLAGTVTANSAVLTWTAPLYTASYTLERRGGDGSVVAINVAGTAASYTDMALRSDTLYAYELLASNSRGSTSPATLTVMTPTIGGTPTRPGYLAMTEGTGGIDLSWTHMGTGQTGFAIERRVANGLWLPLAEVAGSAVSYLDNSALPGMRCMYRLRALYGAQTSAWTTPFSMMQDDTLAITGGVRSLALGGYEVTPGTLGNGALSLKYSAALAAYGLGHTMTQTRNDASGWFGMELGTGATAVEVRELGRFVLPGNTGTHAVKLVNADTGANVASVVVTTAGAPANAFKYTALPSPVSLAANSRFYLLSQETAGGDAWLDPCVKAPGTPTGFQQWLLSHGLPMDGSGTGSATATADGASTLPNLVKYALGLPADVSGDGGRMQHAVVEDEAGDYLTFTFTHPFPAPEGVSYIVESCPTLDHWTTTNIVPVAESVNGGLRTVTVKVDSPDPAKCFVRLKVVRE